MKIQRLTTTGTSTLNVSDALLGGQVNWTLLSQAIRVYLANQRQGTSRVKTRAEVARTKKKWFKQKGTGNARHGARSAPIFVGGGVAHGPSGFQNWSLNLPKRLRKQALVAALSAQAENIVVADTIMDLSGKTKEAAQLLSPIAHKDARVLVILPENNTRVVRALRNMPNVQVTTAQQVTALEVSQVQHVVLPATAIEKLEERVLAAKPEVKSTAKAAAPAKKTRTTSKASK